MSATSKPLFPTTICIKRGFARNMEIELPVHTEGTSMVTIDNELQMIILLTSTQIENCYYYNF